MCSLVRQFAVNEKNAIHVICCNRTAGGQRSPKVTKGHNGDLGVL